MTSFCRTLLIPSHVYSLPCAIMLVVSLSLSPLLPSPFLFTDPSLFLHTRPLLCTQVRILSCSLPPVRDPDVLFSPLCASLPRQVLKRPPPQLRVLRPRAPRRPVRLEVADHERLLEEGQQVLQEKTWRMLDGSTKHTWGSRHQHFHELLCPIMIFKIKLFQIILKIKNINKRCVLVAIFPEICLLLCISGSLSKLRMFNKAFPVMACDIFILAQMDDEHGNTTAVVTTQNNLALQNNIRVLHW